MQLARYLFVLECYCVLDVIVLIQDGIKRNV
jgi:hypothetical protein